MVFSVIREKFGECYPWRILPVHILSSPVVPQRDPDISDEDRQAFQDRLVASAKGQACSLVFGGPENARIDQDKASLLAHACVKLKRSLCLLDCPLLVGKYIGETERNLNRLLAEAESQDWILFFDEADALFGKHSEPGVYPSKDANFSASHLLDIVMKHQGLLILSNKQKETLEALKVRVTALIHFR